MFQYILCVFQARQGTVFALHDSRDRRKPWHAVSCTRSRQTTLPLSFSGSVFPSSVPITIRDISRPWAHSQEQVKHYVVNTSTRNVAVHKIPPSRIKGIHPHKSYTYPIEALLSFLISPWRIAHSLRLRVLIKLLTAPQPNKVIVILFFSDDGSGGSLVSSFVSVCR